MYTPAELTVIALRLNRAGGREVQLVGRDLAVSLARAGHEAVGLIVGRAPWSLGLGLLGLVLRSSYVLPKVPLRE